jgi:hypothetical protein
MIEGVQIHFVKTLDQALELALSPTQAPARPAPPTPRTPERPASPSVH